MAIGAQAGAVVRLMTGSIFFMVLSGAVAGLAAGMASARYLDSLLYQVKPTEWGMLAIPSLAIVVASSLAALPAVARATRIDPATVLRAE